MRDQQPEAPAGQSRPGRLGFVVTACLASAALAAPIAIGATGSTLREGVRNPSAGAASKETLIIARTPKNVYGTRQSNLGAGGAAIYGCRTSADFQELANTAKSTPCLRVNNLGSGLIFSYRFASGSVGGVYQAGGTTANDSKAKPFITNATGVATGLNADRIDNMHADEIIAAGRASLVGPQGPKGDKGEQGDQGARGQAGRGSKWFTGVLAGNDPPSPSYSDSVVGDLFLNTVSNGNREGDVWVKVAASGANAWSQVGNLKGATGPTSAVQPMVKTEVQAYCSQSGHCGTP